MRYRIGFLLVIMATPPSATAEPSTVLRLEEPVKPIEAIKVAERLGQIEFAVTRCGLAPNRDKLDLLVRKQLEGGAGGNMQIEVESLTRKAKAFGMESVCTGLLRMYGPSGSVLADAVLKR